MIGAGAGTERPYGRMLHDCRATLEVVMESSTIKQCPVGEYIRFTETGSVWVRGEYDRTERKYWCHRFDDVNYGRYVTGTKPVFIDFTF